MTKPILINKKEAIKFLGITEKDFKNYHESRGEIQGEKVKGHWYFNKDNLIAWKNLKESRTINLSIKEYEICFEFAIHRRVDAAPLDDS